MEMSVMEQLDQITGNPHEVPVLYRNPTTEPHIVTNKRWIAPRIHLATNGQIPLLGGVAAQLTGW